MSQQSTNLRDQLAALAGLTPGSETTAFTTDTLARTRWAQAHNDAHPNPAWSTGQWCDERTDDADGL